MTQQNRRLCARVHLLETIFLTTLITVEENKIKKSTSYTFSTKTLLKILITITTV